jgi:hypothetical protein
MGGQSDKIYLPPTHPHAPHPGECVRISSQSNPTRMGWPENAVGLVHEGEISLNVFSPSFQQPQHHHQ